MINETTTPQDPQMQELTDGLFVLELEERLEMLEQAADSSFSCCGDS